MMQPQSLLWRLSMLAVIVAGLVTIWACTSPAPQSGADRDPAFEAKVNAALDEIERRGLADWAEYGRAHVGLIGYSEELVPSGALGYTWRFTDAAGNSEYRIALGDRWLALTVTEQGLVLLHELVHMRTGEMGHPQALLDLLAQYERGAP